MSSSMLSARKATLGLGIPRWDGVLIFDVWETRADSSISGGAEPNKLLPKAWEVMYVGWYSLKSAIPCTFGSVPDSKSPGNYRPSSGSLNWPSIHASLFSSSSTRLSLNSISKLSFNLSLPSSNAYLDSRLRLPRTLIGVKWHGVLLLMHCAQRSEIGSQRIFFFLQVSQAYSCQ